MTIAEEKQVQRTAGRAARKALDALAISGNSILLSMLRSHH